MQLMTKVIACFGFAKAARAQLQGTPEDLAAINAVVVEVTEGFNKRDAVAVSGLYTSDAEFTNVLGMTAKGTGWLRGTQSTQSSGGIPMAVGRVKWFNDEKGWGFIKQDAGPDVFVHYSQIQGDGLRRLYEDEVVEFEIKEGPKGLQAINVVRQDGASALS